MEYHVEIKIKMNARFQHIKHILEFISKEKRRLKRFGLSSYVFKPTPALFYAKDISYNTLCFQESERIIFPRTLLAAQPLPVT